MKRIYQFLPLIAAALMLSMGSCSKNDNAALNGGNPDSGNTNNTGTNNNNTGSNNGIPRPILNIRLTDAPTALDSVVVDIQEVRVLFATDSTDSTSSDSSWVVMNTNAGLYDLLSFQNGIDTLIASSPVPADTLQQIRFVLGSNNYVVESGTRYPMTIPSGSQSGLKLNLSRVMDATLQTVVIDFDAAASIRKQGDRYILRPVLIVR